MNVSLKCSCGAFRGVAQNISEKTARRIVCMCDDCQAYAHFLGRADEVLDTNGGTDVFPVVPAKIKITQGIENLKCLRLTETGLLRWYAGCCKTPIANTLASPKIPYAGTIHTIMNHAGDHQTREKALGPIYARIHARFGIGELPKGSHQSAPLKVILTTIKFLLLGWIKRQNQPSPFFNSVGKPVVEPYILTHSERLSLRKLCGPHLKILSREIING